jgi:hypothetical protein
MASDEGCERLCPNLERDEERLVYAEMAELVEIQNLVGAELRRLMVELDLDDLRMVGGSEAAEVGSMTFTAEMASWGASLWTASELAVPPLTPSAEATTAAAATTTAAAATTTTSPPLSPSAARTVLASPSAAPTTPTPPPPAPLPPPPAPLSKQLPSKGLGEGGASPLRKTTPIPGHNGVRLRCSLRGGIGVKR